MSNQALNIQKELSNVRLQKSLGFPVNSNLKRNANTEKKRRKISLSAL